MAINTPLVAKTSGQEVIKRPTLENLYRVYIGRGVTNNNVNK
jgi:hypothetical protein